MIDAILWSGLLSYHHDFHQGIPEDPGRFNHGSCRWIIFKIFGVDNVHSSITKALDINAELAMATEATTACLGFYPKTVVDLIASYALLEANVIINVLDFNAGVNECQMSQEKLCVINDH